MHPLLFHLPPLFCNCTCLSNVFIIFIKRFSIFPVVKCSYSHNVFFLVDNRQGQDIFNDPASVIYRSFLKTIKALRLFFLMFNSEIIIDLQNVAKEMYREVPGTVDPVFSMDHLVNQEIDLICEAYSNFTIFICIYLCVHMCVWFYANSSHE